MLTPANVSTLSLPEVKITLEGGRRLRSVAVAPSPHFPVDVTVASARHPGAAAHDAPMLRMRAHRLEWMANVFTQPLDFGANGVSYSIAQIICTTCGGFLQWTPNDPTPESGSFCPVCAAKEDPVIFCKIHPEQKMIIDAAGACGPKGDLVCLQCAIWDFFNRPGSFKWNHPQTLRLAQRGNIGDIATLQGIDGIRWEPGK